MHPAMPCRRPLEMMQTIIMKPSTPSGRFSDQPKTPCFPIRSLHSLSGDRHYSGDGRSSLGVWESFSLKPANRLASGSPDSRMGTLYDEGATEGRSSGSRGRLGTRSPVDCRIAWRVCHPSVDLSWNESARSCWLATRHSRASSS